MNMAKTSKKSFPLIKVSLFLFLLFQGVLIFLPPSLDKSAIEKAPNITLEKLLQNIDQYVDKPVIIDDVRIANPAYFYLGSSFYLESIETGSRILVLGQEYPPKEGTIVSILGVIQPVFSLNEANLAYFKPVNVIVDDSLEANL